MSKSFLTSIFRRLFGIVVILTFTIIGLEFASFYYIKNYKSEIEKIRLLLRGELIPDSADQMSIGQAYLNYIPRPQYSDSFGVQHNEMGFRGTAVPFLKPPNTIRILCLGGSTTYGWGIGEADQTYPAHLEKILNSKYMNTGIKFEVINGGLPFGTTAENLTHYHFKFHYFKPDLVILNVGGNDALGLTWDSYYHPDYSNWRNPLKLPEALSPFGRKLLRSRLISLIFISVFYGDQPLTQSFIRSTPPYARWYPAVPAADENGSLVPDQDWAFKHNLEKLVDQILDDGAKVILVPFRAAPKTVGYIPALKKQFVREEEFLDKLAEKLKLPLARNPLSIYPTDTWIDDCHTDSRGAFIKAEHINNYVLDLMKATIEKTSALHDKHRN